MSTTSIPPIGSSTNPDIKVVGPTPNPLSGQTVPMFAPSGELGDVPVENAKAARTQGFKDAVGMTASSGDHGYVPVDRVSDALQKGFVLHDSVAGITPETSRAMNSPETGLPGVGAGVAKGATNTMHGALKAAAKYVGGMTDEQAEQAASRALPAMTYDTTSQKVGAGIEAVGEFILGDEALKSLSLSQRLGLASKVSEMVEKSPRLAKAVDIGINSLRQGTVAGGQEFAKTGGDVNAAAKTGATVAAGSALLGGAIEGVKALRVNPFRVSAVAATEPGYVSQILHGEDVAQPTAQSALRTGAESVTGKTSPASLRASLDQPISDTLASAKKLYRQVDEASGTNFGALNEKLSNTEYQLSLTPDGSPEEAKWEASRQNLLDKIADAKQKALDAGVDPDTLKTADAQFTRARALQDLQTKVFKNSSIVEGNASMGTPETIKVDAAVKALQKLQDSTKYGGPRLEQALGKDAANALLKSLYDAQRLGEKAVTRQELLQKIVKVSKGIAIGGGALYGGWELLRHMLGD